MTVYIGVDFHPYEQTVKAIEKAIGVKSDRGHKAIGVKKAIGIRPSILRFVDIVFDLGLNSSSKWLENRDSRLRAGCIM